MSLVKPSGTPTMKSNSLTSGMLLYVVDCGNNHYTIVHDSTTQAPRIINPPVLFAGHTDPHLNGDPRGGPWDVNPATLTSVDHGYGLGVDWPGTAGVADMGTLVYVIDEVNGGDDLRLAVALSDKSNGSGYTMGTTFMQTGDVASDGGQIWGRPVHLDSGEYGVGNIYMRTTDHIIFTWLATRTTSDPVTQSPQILVSTNAVTRNVPHTVVVSMVKNSGGVDIYMYIDGVQEGYVTATGLHSNGGDQEDQYQIGSKFHIAGSQPSGYFKGNVFQAFVSGRAWSQAEADTLTLAPYSALQFTATNTHGFLLAKQP